jgi:hypothetical protein
MYCPKKAPPGCGAFFFLTSKVEFKNIWPANLALSVIEGLLAGYYCLVKNCFDLSVTPDKLLANNK